MTNTTNYSSRLCFHQLNHNHDTKDFMCHSVSINDSIQCVTGTQPKEQPARR